MTIWKYEIPIDDEIMIKMPMGARVLAVQVQRGVPRLWVLVDPLEPVHVRTFYVVGTGNQMPDDPCVHVGTFQTQSGLLVWHLFERAA